MKLDLSRIICGGFVCVGLLLLGLFIKGGIDDFANRGRQVTVRGLSERTVEANSVTWPIVTKEMGNDLVEIYNRIQATNQQITDFLKSNGLKDNEFSINPPQVEDRIANTYTNDNQVRQRYLVTNVIVVSSEQVKLVNELIKKQPELMRRGIAIVAGDYQYSTSKIWSSPPLVEVVDGAVAVAYLIVGAGCDGGGYVVLAAARGLVERGAAGQPGSDGRRQGAARAVGVGCGEFGRGQAQAGVALGVVKYIDECVGALEVAGLEHHRYASAGHAAQGAGGVLELVLAVDGLAQQQRRLGEIGGDDGAVGHELVAQCGDGLGLQQRIARGGHHYWVEHDAAHVGILAQCREDGAYEVGAVQHTNLHCVGADVAQHRAYLPGHEVLGNWVHAVDAHGILVDDGHDSRRAVDSQGRECLEVGLQAGATRGVAAGDGQSCIVSFHFSCQLRGVYAASQNSHSMREARIYASVMRSRVASDARAARRSQMAMASSVARSKAGSL